MALDLRYSTLQHVGELTVKNLIDRIRNILLKNGGRDWSIHKVSWIKLANKSNFLNRKAVAAYDKWILSCESSDTNRVSFIKEEEEGEEEESEKYVRAFSDLGLQISAHQGSF